ncbi:MAG: carbon storage regulator [Ruminococcus sp.]|jgi:carbon storage regulator|nr:carbon storage regulator [Ruminococcus sp.]
MLIISRKKDESILIGENIKITLIETGDGRVKIGVDAPREVRVIRAEAADMLEFNRSAKASKLPEGLLQKLKSQSGAIDKL